MATLIARLRAMCAAGTADHTVGSVTYWTDDQLQERLDRTRRTFYRLWLAPDPAFEEGAFIYLDYSIPVGPHFEEAGSTSGWAVRDGEGAVISSGYSVNYAARRITFDADQAGAVRTLDCRVYDLDAAAALVWEDKAAFAAARADWSSDNHSVKASQEYEHCMAMAQRYRDASGARFAPFVRTDEV